MALATVDLEDGHVAGCGQDVEYQKHAGDGDVDIGGGCEAELGCETGVGGPVLEECVNLFSIWGLRGFVVP